MMFVPVALAEPISIIYKANIFPEYQGRVEERRIIPFLL